LKENADNKNRSKHATDQFYFTQEKPVLDRSETNRELQKTE